MTAVSPLASPSPPSPLSVYRAQLQQRFLVTPPTRPVEGFQPPTPAFTRGEYTMLDEGTLRISVELGPLLINHVFRGSDASHLISVWA